MTKLELKGVSNPGWSFTQDRITQLNDFWEWFSLIDDDKVLTYKSIQNEIEQENLNIDSSKIRMFFPFLRDLGMIYSYNDKFYKKDLFTESGSIFLSMVLPLYVRKEQFDEKVKTKILRLFSLFLLDGFIHLYKNNDKPIYQSLVEILKEKDSIDYNGFFLIADGVENRESKDSIMDRLYEYEKNKDSISVEIKKNQNAFGYIVPFLEQANIVYREENVLILNKSILHYLEG